MIYSQNFITWLTSLEGFIPYVYDDADSKTPRRDWEKSDKRGYATFGVGHLLTTSDSSLRKFTTASPASKQFVIDLFVSDIAGYAAVVASAIKVPLKPFQYDALVSLCYNIGKEGFKTSMVVSSINKGVLSGDVLKGNFNSWIKSKGVRNLTLVDRRSIEFKLFTTGVYTTYNQKPFFPVKK